MTKFEAAKTIPASEVAERYAGLRIRNNKAVCPFHPDHDPSCTFYKNGTFYCFGCNEHGTSVDFVAKYKKIPIRDAALLICADYGLQHDDDQTPPAKREKPYKEIKADAENALRRFHNAACDYGRLLEKFVQDSDLPADSPEIQSAIEEWTALGELLARFDRSLEDSLEVMEEFADMVGTWEKAVAKYGE